MTATNRVRRKVVLAVLICAVAVPRAVEAASATFTDRQQWLAAVGVNTPPTIDFEELPVSYNAVLSLMSKGVRFDLLGGSSNSNGLFILPQAAPGFGSQTGNYLLAANNNFYYGAVTVTFPSGITAFGVDLFTYCPHCDPDGSVVNLTVTIVTEEGNVVAQVNSASASSFFGIVSTREIASATFEGSYVLMDNLSFTGTPSNLTVTSVSGDLSASTGILTVSDTVKNTSFLASAAASVNGYYLDATPALTTSSIALTGTRSVPALAPGMTDDGLAVPTIPLTTVGGDYYVIACADASNAVNETDETDNCRPSTNTIHVPSDVVPIALSSPPPFLHIGPPPVQIGPSAAFPIAVTNIFSVEDTYRNAAATTSAVSFGGYFLSLDGVRQDYGLIGARTVPALAPGQSDTRTTSLEVGMATPAGRYYVLSCVAQRCLASSTRTRVVDFANAIKDGIGTVTPPSGADITWAFTPNFQLTPKQAAELGGFDHFNWYQELIGNDLGSIPNPIGHYLGVDPQLGGNQNQKRTCGGAGADLFKWYFNEYLLNCPEADVYYIGTALSQGSNQTLPFFDAPNAVIPGVVWTFDTYLAAVHADGSGEPILTVPGLNVHWKYTQTLSGGTIADVTVGQNTPGGPSFGSSEFLSFINPEDLTPDRVQRLKLAGLVGPDASIAATPQNGRQSETLDLNITGTGTHFAQGVSLVTFSGPGVTVNQFTVASQASGVANISISSDAPAFARDVYVATGNEVAAKTGAFTITAPVACSFNVSFPLSTVSSSGATGTAVVTAPSGCSWSASSSDTSVGTITSGATGSGNGTVGFAIAANSNPTPRSVTFTIAGQTFLVLQSGVTCSFAIGGSAQTVPPAGGSGTIGVSTAPSSCSWTATSDAAWLSVTSGASGTGGGTVGYSVAVNALVATRIGHLTIAGATFTVTQTGIVGSVTVNPSSATVLATGGTGTVTVTANAADFGWSASTPATWLHITAGATGTGNGTVTWLADANPSSLRTATISIAGQAASVAQAGSIASPLVFVTNVYNGGNVQIALVDTATDQVVGFAPTPGGFTHAVTVTPDGLQAWAANDFGNEIDVLDTAARVVATIPVPNHPRAAAFTPDGTRAYVVNEVGVVTVIDTATRSVLRTIDLAQWGDYAACKCGWIPYLMNIVISPDGGRAYMADATGNVISFDTTSDAPLHRLALPITGQWVALTPDGTKALVTSGNGSGVSALFVVDTAVDQILQRVDLGGGTPRGVAVSPDGTRAYVANEGGFVSTVNLATYTVIGSVPISNGARGIVVHPDGSKLYATASSQLAVVELATSAVTYVTLGAGNCCTVQLAVQAPLPRLRLSAGSATISASTTGGAIGVVALRPDVAWTAISSASWLTIVSGGSGTGNGTVTYAVTPNMTGAPRRATITVAGQVFTVVQQEGHYSISTIAGRLLPLSAPALSIPFWVNAVTTDSAGNLYVSGVPRAVFKVSGGTATRVAGDGTNLNGPAVEGGPATAARFSMPRGLAVDAARNVYVADEYYQRIRRSTPRAARSRRSPAGTEVASAATAAQPSTPSCRMPE